MDTKQEAAEKSPAKFKVDVKPFIPSNRGQFTPSIPPQTLQMIHSLVQNPEQMIRNELNAQKQRAKKMRAPKNGQMPNFN